jgi:phenylalanyl-tRNA synthetase beta chain
MKFTLSWLKDHLDTDADVARIAATLTSLGLEVEDLTDRAADLAPYVIARVVEAQPHPNADKLRVCMVDLGQGGPPISVVCGAPNARTGMKSVYAPAGTYIPGKDLTLTVREVRGVVSNGMLCSAMELGLSDDHEGIIDLAPDAPTGAGYAQWAGLGDPVIEIALTPDRADCAGVRGIARDLAAAGLGTLKPLARAEPVAGTFANPVPVHLDFPPDAAGACPLFLGRLIRGVRNGPSPAWMQDRLTAIGLRPISALVDVTNFLTMDVARPLHVFDADAIRGGALTVRMARDGETLEALNGKTYALDPAITVIADAHGVESLGGIMGGVRSGCTDTTVNVYIEAALFDPVRTAQTGRRLGVESDARYRFERGLDPAFVAAGMDMATRLILEMCGGEASDVFVAGTPPDWRRTLTLRGDRVARLGGMDVSVADQVRILRDLGFGVTEGEPMTVVPPSWRADVHGEADLVEEVMRVAGFDNLPATPLPRTGTMTRPALDARQRRVATVRRAIAARGLEEAVTWAFMSGTLAARFGQVDPGLRLVNPIASDLDVMRPSIIPNLIQAAGRNADRGFPDVALFELGPQYRTPEPDGQQTMATGVRAGLAVPRQWAGGSRPVDLHDAKADALAVLEAAGAPVGNLQVTTDAPDWYHPGRSGTLRLGPTVLARFGETHPEVLDLLGAKGPMVQFEVFLDAVPAPKKKTGTARPLLKLSALQPLVRDFAFVVDAKTEADRVVRAVRGADKAMVADVAVFDVYQGPGVGEGRKSLALSVTLQPTEKTLTEAEIDAVGQKIVAAVAKAAGGVLRG